MTKKNETETPAALSEQDLKGVKGAGTKQPIKKTLDQQGVTHRELHGSDFNAAKSGN